MATLSEYGGRIIETDGQRTVEMRDPNDGAKRRYQYRRSGPGLERRILAHDGADLSDGSPWETIDILPLLAQRGTYHPILDPLDL